MPKHLHLCDRGRRARVRSKRPGVGRAICAGRPCWKSPAPTPSVEAPGSVALPIVALAHHRIPGKRRLVGSPDPRRWVSLLTVRPGGARSFPASDAKLRKRARQSTPGAALAVPAAARRHGSLVATGSLLPVCADAGALAFASSHRISTGRGHESVSSPGQHPGVEYLRAGHRARGVVARDWGPPPPSGSEGPGDGSDPR